MKLLCLIILLLSISCDSDIKKEFKFEGNSTTSDIDKEIRNIVSAKDLSIVNFQYLEDSCSVWKIFCLKDNTWEKIQIVKGLSLIDSNTKDKIEIIDSEFVLKKICSKPEDSLFLNSLIKNNLFKLKEQSKVNHCSTSKYYDGDRYYFQLISRNKVRTLIYNNVNSKIEECPSVQEYKDVIEIQNLFKRSWLKREHTLK